MLFAFARSIVQEAEVAATKGADLMTVLPLLRKLSLEDFGLLLISMPNSEYPALSNILPVMASEAVQKQWTGKSGLELFTQTAGFARVLESANVRHAGQSLFGKTILDFGCGYGRNMRSMLYFTDPENLWGVDAWNNSLELSRQARIPGHLAQSAACPTSLPVEDTRFDFAFAFSIFTHLSRNAAEACLAAVRKSMKSGGLFVPTIRPVEYWDLDDDGRRSAAERKKLRADHERDGFAFAPHTWSKDGSYGDTSMTLDFFRRDGWQLLGYDNAITDSYQIAVVLKAV